MDTLTVPHTKAERTMAINRMRETYQNADRVLTFVQDFEDVDKDMKPLEFFVRLACCSWMRRLWTLQEGVFAKRLYFWFKGGPVSFEEMSENYDTDCRNYANVGSKLVGTLQSWRALASDWEKDGIALSEADKFPALQTALQYRATSRQKDEAVCVATLLGYDVLPFLTLDSSAARMKEFWLRLKDVPTGVLWMAGNKLSDRGLRWAPSTLLNTLHRTHFYGGEPLRLGRVEEEGLRLSTFGFRLYQTHIPLEKSFYFMDQTDGAYYGASSDSWLTNDTDPCELLRYALLLKRSPDRIAAKPQRSNRVVKVSITRQEKGDAIYTRLEEIVTLWRVTQGLWEERTKQKQSEKERSREKERGRTRFAVGERLAVDQVWVVG